MDGSPAAAPNSVDAPSASTHLRLGGDSCKSEVVRVGLRMLKPATVRWLRQALELGQLSRAALARELCARDQWNNARGKPCAASARKALPQLAAQLGLALPAAVAPVAFEGSLEALGPGRAPGCRLTYSIESRLGPLQPTLPREVLQHRQLDLREQRLGGQLRVSLPSSVSAASRHAISALIVTARCIRSARRCARPCTLQPS